MRVGNDTIIGISVDQLREVNKKFTYIHYLEDKTYLLTLNINESLKLSLAKDSLIASKSDVIFNLKQLNLSAIKDMNNANKSISKLTTDRDKYKKRVKTFSYISLISIFVTIVAVL